MDYRSRILDWWLSHGGIAVWLFLAFLVLLPFGGLYNIALLAACGLGLWYLVSSPKDALGDEGARLLLALFLCIWVPMAVAAVDAVNPAQSWRKVISFPVFFLGGVYAVKILRHGVALRRLLIGVWAICIFWSVDAVWQFLHGSNLLGFPYDGGRVAGVFYPDLKLGIALATVSPLVLEGMRKLSQRTTWVWLTLIPFVAAIILSGSRSSWIVLGAVLGVYGWYLFRRAGEHRVRLRAIVRVLAVGVLACIVIVYVVPQSASQARELLGDRAGPVVHLLRGDAEKADGAVKARLSAWETVGRILRVHWFNGVGPRGFREVYDEFAPRPNPDMAQGGPLNYPHLFVLEIAAETGIVGVLGYLTALAVLLRRLLAMNRTQLAHGFPYWLAIAVVLFPFATHLAFYAHFMGALIWWTIAVSAAGFAAAMRCGGCGE